MGLEAPIFKIFSKEKFWWGFRLVWFTHWMEFEISLKKRRFEIFGTSHMSRLQQSLDKWSKQIFLSGKKVFVFSEMVHPVDHSCQATKTKMFTKFVTFLFVIQNCSASIYSSVWCHGSHQDHRHCSFSNLCYSPHLDQYLFFHRFVSFPIRPYIHLDF